MSIRPKAFIEALCCFSSDPEKSRTFLNDNRLTRSEKIILRSYFHFRKNHLQKVTDLLVGMREPLPQVQESQRLLLLGMVHISKSEFDSASDYLERSLKMMKGHDLHHFEFIGLLNLFIVNHNLKDEKRMGAILESLNSISPLTELEQLRVMFCHFTYYSFKENFVSAKKWLGKIDLKKELMPEADRMSHLICKFDLAIKMDDLKMAQDALEEMKKQRNFNLTENYKYMKLLLAHYTEKSPLYFNDNEFKAHFVLFHQLKVIQKLEEGQRSTAIGHWNRLRELYPELYDDDFNFKGGKTIFSLCLERYRGQKLNLISGKSDQTFEEILYKVLKNSNVPLRKEILFEMVWGTFPESKDDLAKLSRWVSRIRIKYGLNIKTRKGAYFVEEKMNIKKIKANL